MIIYWEQPATFNGVKAQKKFLNRWTHLAKAFGIDKICFIDVDGSEPFVNDSEIDFNVARNIKDALKLFPKKNPVYVEQGGKPLAKYKHPKNAVYIFGSDYKSLEKATVSIDSKLALYSDHAASIILHDRITQWPLP